MGRWRDWRWQRRVRRVMRRDGAQSRGHRRGRSGQPDPVLVRRAASLTDLRERRAAYEAAQHAPASRPPMLRGVRVVAVLTVVAAATLTFALTVLAAVVGGAWLAGVVAALTAAALTAFARRGVVTTFIDNGARPPRQFRDVREPLDD